MRTSQTALGNAIAASFATPFPLAARSMCGQAQAGIVNSGLVRIDDEIPVGPVTEYDVLRIIPFKEQVVVANLTGKILLKVLQTGGEPSLRSGAFLQVWNIREEKSGQYFIGSDPLQEDNVYTVAIPSFLISGKERNFAFFHPEAEGVTVLDDQCGGTQKHLIYFWEQK